MKKLINGLLIARSNMYPNYGTSVCGRPFRWDTEKEMTVNEHGGGKQGQYLAFRGCHDNIPQNIYLHKCVADCWVINDSKETKTQVNHIDGNKLNPRAENLEWVTPSQNQHHALLLSLKQSTDALYNSELSTNEVHRICQMLCDGVSVNTISQIFSVSKDIIRKLRAGDTYFSIRRLYVIPHTYKYDPSESTVRWVCERIVEGMSDKKISDIAINKNITTIEIKRIRNKVRFRTISDEYF